MGNVIDVVVVASTAQAEASLKRVGSVAESELGGGGKLGKACNEAEGALGKAGKGAGNFLTGLTGLSPKMLGAAAIGTGLALAADGVFKAFEANQKATLNLEVEMKNAGEKVTPAFTRALTDAQHAGENLGFAQSDTTTTMGALTLAGLTTAQAFKQLPVIMDLARAKNISVAEATEMYVKGIAGAGRGLKAFNVIGLMTLPTTAAIAAAHVKLAADTKKYGAASVQARADQEKLNTTLNIAAVRAHNLAIMHDELGKKVGGAAKAATHTLGVEWGIVTAKFNDFAGQAIPAVEGGIAAVLQVLGDLVNWVVANVLPKLMPVFQTIGDVIKALIPIFKVVFAIIVGVIKVALAIMGVEFKIAFAIIGAVIGTVINVIKSIATVLSAVFSVVGRVVSAAIGPAKAVIDGIISAINAVISVIDAIQVHIHFGPVNMDWNGLRIPKIPMLYEGGIVPGSPAGMLAVVGDRNRSEAIIPLSSLKGGKHGGGDTYNVTTNVASPADPNSISRAVVFGLRSRSRASLEVA